MMAMLMQNANSANVAPDSHAVRRGLTREDLFLCVHEQFMTATAQCADIVLPASMFLEHDDIYYGLGHTAITVGRRVLDRHAACWSNHEVICALAKRLGAEHPGFHMSEWSLVDATLQASGLGTAEAAAQRGYVECGPSFREGHFLDGFPNETGRFRFKPDWNAVGPYGDRMPPLPDYFDAIEQTSEHHPFRLVAPPARTFLNTSFTETPSSRKREQGPCVLMHPEDAHQLGVQDGDRVQLGNRRGEVVLGVKHFNGVHTGTVIAEGIWPNRDFQDGLGINHLIGADPVPPAGGVAFHDTAVWLHKV